MQSYLKQVFIFSNFDKAIDFVFSIKNICNKLDHHPEIRIFNYKKVEIISTTHSADNIITEKDNNLLKEINKLYTNS